MTWYTNHKELVSLQYVFFCFAFYCHFLKMTWYTDHKEMVSLQYEFFYAFSNCNLLKMTWYTDHNRLSSSMLLHITSLRKWQVSVLLCIFKTQLFENNLRHWSRKWFLSCMSSYVHKTFQIPDSFKNVYIKIIFCKRKNPRNKKMVPNFSYSCHKF